MCARLLKPTLTVLTTFLNNLLVHFRQLNTLCDYTYVLMSSGITFDIENRDSECANVRMLPKIYDNG